MAKKAKLRSPLVEAAEKLQQSLDDHGRAVRELLRTDLDSKRNVERAEQALGRINQCGEELGRDVGALVAAITTARDEQQAEAEQAATQAQLVLERRAVLDNFLKRQEMLAQAVGSATALLEAVRSEGRDDALPQALAQIATLTELATDLADDGKASAMNDIAGEAHALKQQLDAIRNRASLIKQKRPQA